YVVRRTAILQLAIHAGVGIRFRLPTKPGKDNGQDNAASMRCRSNPSRCSTSTGSYRNQPERTDRSSCQVARTSDHSSSPEHRIGLVAPPFGAGRRVETEIDQDTPTDQIQPDGPTESPAQFSEVPLQAFPVGTLSHLTPQVSRRISFRNKSSNVQCVPHAS